MTTDPNIWMGVIEKSYQFYAYVFTLYVICMGLLRWYGQTTWRRREERCRKAAGLPVASCFSNAEQGFTYTSLLQGGFDGALITAAQMAWVLLMLGFFWLQWAFVSLLLLIFLGGPPLKLTDLDVHIWELVSILMYFPVIMVASVALRNLFTSRHRISLRSFVLAICLIVACVAATIIAVWATADRTTLVLVQLFSVAVMSLCMSFFMGIANGLRLADPEASYPLVSVELQQGAGFDRVWLYERTDSDYRFLSATGANYVVPAANVTKITKIGDQS